MSTNINTPLIASLAGPLYRHCGICNIEQNLLRCAGCQMIQYCSKEHQAAHWVKHKSSCTTFKKRRVKLDKEEQILRVTPKDGNWNDGDPFVTGVGNFWDIVETRDYMRLRYSLVEAILEVNTLDAVQSALDHLLDMLRLCRGDNIDVRKLVPALQLRLGKDRECYDFVKWWATTGEDDDYDWGNIELPYLDTKGADIFEPVWYLCKDYLELAHKVSITLLKLRLFLAIKECLANAAVLRESKSLPAEIFNQVEDSLLRGVVGEKWDHMNSTRRSQLLDVLSSQVNQLYDVVKRSNKHFWPALLNPGENLNARPQYHRYGSKEEMQLVLGYSYASWRESPGALELIAARR